MTPKPREPPPRRTTAQPEMVPKDRVRWNPTDAASTAVVHPGLVATIASEYRFGGFVRSAHGTPRSATARPSSVLTVTEETER